MDNRLVDVHPELEEHIHNISFLGEHLGLRGITPANAGDISILLSQEAGEVVLQRLERQSELVRFDRLSELAAIRRDGRTYYNAESVPEEIIQNQIRPLANRVVLITATGAKLWDIARHPERRLCVIEISSDCQGFYLVYGNQEHGLIPSIETLSHLIALSVNIREGFPTAAAFHAHPPAIVAIASHASIESSYAKLNKLLYTQREGILTNMSDLVGIVPYAPSGSRALLETSIESITRHRFTLWGHHGVFIRERTVERCVDLLEYAENAAEAALQALIHPQMFEGTHPHRS